ncbi:class I mannose-6-phosphate isomerase [Streptomyces griseomycini]|uniref:Mannose-6-phosphate isomerase n=2 Tax=Streptomyces griseomycini TaxID=66895 RepID=A0A7W7PV38_9ACTN|nr:class I mannose-6-phosphate isomerase [Streptomyces griseomycini]MBB4901824.1 mannose-6-phosphate isomerase [Streptomyces griseomycini]GGQ29950.1 mannose-6-phosphate isomerase [Streptomyces griseomycini]
MSAHGTDLYPLRLSVTARPLVFGGHAIARRLGKKGIPDWSIAETWECSDVTGAVSVVTGGPLAGRSLRQVVADHPEALMGAGWSGRCFPVLTKFIDAAGALPVHLHADDETARRLEGQPNGKTEAWHILDAAPGATALCGVKDGVTADRLRAALEAQDFDAVLRRLPVRAGDTVYVPGGTLHSFGPDTLVYEIEQTSDIQQHAMRWNMEDGSPVGDAEFGSHLDLLMQQVDLGAGPDATPGLRIAVGDGAERVFLCAGPYFALERLRAGTPEPLRHTFATAQVLSNVGAPVRVRTGAWSEELGRAETLLLPAACGEVEITGPADVLFGYLPDLDRDVRGPLLGAGCPLPLIDSLGASADARAAGTRED